MPWPFKKKNDFVNLTAMKESGLLDRSIAIKRSQDSDTIELTPKTLTSPSVVSSAEGTKEHSSFQSTDTSGGFLSFLDNSSSNSQPSPITSSSSSASTGESYNERLRAARHSRLAECQEPSSEFQVLDHNQGLKSSRKTLMFNSLKNKVEDLEYKLERLMEKVNQLT